MLTQGDMTSEVLEVVKNEATTLIKAIDAALRTTALAPENREKLLRARQVMLDSASIKRMTIPLVFEFPLTTVLSEEDQVKLVDYYLRNQVGFSGNEWPTNNAMVDRYDERRAASVRLEVEKRTMVEIRPDVPIDPPEPIQDTLDALLAA